MSPLAREPAASTRASGADIISYEEYHPYGTTAYQASNSAINAVSKRYRYTGKERDEESGLYYHGARYYIPWLARWTACDPLESKYSPLSPYNYCENNPVMLVDPSGMKGEETINATGFSAFGAVPTVDNTRVYQRPNIDQLPAMSSYHVEPANETLEGYAGAFKQEAKMAYSMQSASENPTVLMADIYGVGHIGPKSQVESTLRAIQQEYANAVLENIRGGPFAAAGYWLDGEEGTFRGAIFDQMSYGTFMSHGLEPVRTEKVETNFGARLEPATATATVKPVVNTTTAKTPIEVSGGRGGVGTTITVTPEQAAQVNPAYNVEIKESGFGPIQFVFSGKKGSPNMNVYITATKDGTHAELEIDFEPHEVAAGNLTYKEANMKYKGQVGLENFRPAIFDWARSQGYQTVQFFGFRTTGKNEGTYQKSKIFKL